MYLIAKVRLKQPISMAEFWYLLRNFAKIYASDLYYKPIEDEILSQIAKGRKQNLGKLIFGIPNYKAHLQINPISENELSLMWDYRFSRIKRYRNNAEEMIFKTLRQLEKEGIIEIL